MRKKSGWVTHVLILAAVLLATVVILILIDKPQTNRQEALLERIAPLERERDRLIVERDTLAYHYRQQQRHPATEHLLFPEPESRLYTELFPKMKKAGMTGCIVLSAGNLPGDAGMITSEQFEELLKAGWDTCVLCPKGASFASWNREITQLLEEAGLEKPAVVYFEEGAFSGNSEEILRCGYTVAVHHGEGGRSLMGKDSSDALWLTGARPWNFSGVREEIQTLVSERGDMCYVVRFSEGGELYKKDGFATMLDYLAPYLKKGSLLVTDFGSSREVHSIHAERMEITEEQFEQETSALEEQIRAINEQIREAYDEWNGGEHD